MVEVEASKINPNLPLGGMARVEKLPSYCQKPSVYEDNTDKEKDNAAFVYLLLSSPETILKTRKVIQKEMLKMKCTMARSSKKMFANFIKFHFKLV